MTEGERPPSAWAMEQVERLRGALDGSARFKRFIFWPTDWPDVLARALDAARAETLREAVDWLTAADQHGAAAILEGWLSKVALRARGEETGR
jgi:hypothetical protein